MDSEVTIKEKEKLFVEYILELENIISIASATSEKPLIKNQSV